MITIDVFGPVYTILIRIFWFMSGVSFGIYAWKITDKKIDAGLIIISLFGPTGWIFFLILNLFLFLVKRQSKQYISVKTKQLFVTLSLLLSVIIVLIPFILLQQLQK